MIIWTEDPNDPIAPVVPLTLAVRDENEFAPKSAKIQKRELGVLETAFALVRNIGYSLNLHLHPKQKISPYCSPRRLGVGKERGIGHIHLRIVIQVTKIDGCLKHVFQAGLRRYQHSSKVFKSGPSLGFGVSWNYFAVLVDGSLAGDED